MDFHMEIGSIVRPDEGELIIKENMNSSFLIINNAMGF